MRRALISSCLAICAAACATAPRSPSDDLMHRFDQQARRNGGARLSGACPTVHAVTSCILRGGGTLDVVAPPDGTRTVMLWAPVTSEAEGELFERSRAALAQVLGDAWLGPACSRDIAWRACSFEERLRHGED